MARMMGAAAWDGLYCYCCNDRRSNHHQRQREKRELLRWRDEYEDPADVLDRACPKGGPDCGCRRYLPGEVEQ